MTTATFERAARDSSEGEGRPVLPFSLADQANRRERRLYDAWRDGGDRVPPSTILQALARAGIGDNDPRVAETVRAVRRRDAATDLPYDEFVEIVRPGLLILERVAKRELVIPEFEAFAQQAERIFDVTTAIQDGAVATYIPQLARVFPDRYGAAICTIDGQRLSLGDAATPFAIQSACKPILYGLALEERGEEVVHRHIGTEPSGQRFNELTLNGEGRPHNPMINAGAIMNSALIRPDDTMADRFEYVLERWEAMAGGVRPGFSNPMYLSERRTADRNFALGYFMRENGAFPEGTDLLEALEFYFQCCSLEVTAEIVAVVAATLANGGVCPTTGERVFSADTVRKTLSLMYSCGMYDFSGEWGFRIGLPAKSGVSGVIMTVVPNVLGLCTWAPPLDDHGNSVRGIAFCRELVDTFNFHNYDNLVEGLSGKTDPRLRRDQVARDLLVDSCWAASEGDVDGLRRLVVQGADLNGADYDGRTALHLAASEGQEAVVAFLLESGVDPAPVDRWGNTPLVDARRGRHDGCAVRLEGALS